MNVADENEAAAVGILSRANSLLQHPPPPPPSLSFTILHFQRAERPQPKRMNHDRRQMLPTSLAPFSHLTPSISHN